MLAAEATEAVPWTKPDELLYDPAKPVPALGDPQAKSYSVVMANRSVVVVPRDLDEKTLRAMITIGDGIKVDLSKLQVIPPPKVGME
jgi:hypothetical protein